MGIPRDAAKDAAGITVNGMPIDSCEGVTYGGRDDHYHLLTALPGVWRFDAAHE